MIKSLSLHLLGWRLSIYEPPSGKSSPVVKLFCTSFDGYKMAKSNILITFAVGKVHRDVAQLVARHVRDVEVGSSSLLIPTNKQEDVLSKDLFSTSFLYLLRGGGLSKSCNH